MVDRSGALSVPAQVDDGLLGNEEDAYATRACYTAVQWAMRGSPERREKPGRQQLESLPLGTNPP